MPDLSSLKRKHGGTRAPGTKVRHGHARRLVSGRAPQWAIDEAGQRQNAVSPTATNPEARRPRRGGIFTGWLSPGAKRSSAVATAAVVAVCASAVFLNTHVLPVVQSNLPWSDVPPVGVEAAPLPLGTPPAVRDSTAYRLHASPDKGQEFVAYDPCRPIHYVIRPDGAPEDGERLVREAVEAVSAASGFRFVYDGTTTEGPSEQRTQYQPERYGKRWAPVLVSWSSPAEVPGLAGDVAGLGSSSYISARGTPLVRTAGQVILDGPDAASMLGRKQGAEHLRAAVMHEFGHVLGLDHVQDPNQLMYDGPNYQTGFAAGDLAGLAKLGTGACVPQL